MDSISLAGPLSPELLSSRPPLTSDPHSLSSLYTLGIKDVLRSESLFLSLTAYFHRPLYMKFNTTECEENATVSHSPLQRAFVLECGPETFAFESLWPRDFWERPLHFRGLCEKYREIEMRVRTESASAQQHIAHANTPTKRVTHAYAP